MAMKNWNLKSFDQKKNENFNLSSARQVRLREGYAAFIQACRSPLCHPNGDICLHKCIQNITITAA